MKRKAIPEKIKKSLYQEAGMTCPLCGEKMFLPLKYIILLLLVKWKFTKKII